jgi:uncharacterized SAM-binding protein YcdF (DUF218 family)
VKAEAFYSADILESWGVPTDAIIVETNSRNTYENARQTKKILQTREIDTILLVTSAFHMPRALATFRHVGPRVLPSPSGYSMASYKKPVLLEWWPTLGNLAKAQALVHENLGILIYRLRGWAI